METLTKTYTKQELIELVRANKDTQSGLSIKECKDYVRNNSDKAPFIFIVDK